MAGAGARTRAGGEQRQGEHGQQGQAEQRQGRALYSRQAGRQASARAATVSLLATLRPAHPPRHPPALACPPAVKLMRVRERAAELDFSEFLDEETEAALKEAGE